MKERIEFITESSIKGRKEIAKINEYVNNFNFDCAFERKIEQIPENFEELKELCKNIKRNKKDLGGAMWFEFPVPKDSKLWPGKFLCIDEKGQIGIAEKTFGNDISITIFADSLTPARQWQIIKSLIGAE